MNIVKKEKSVSKILILVLFLISFLATAKENVNPCQKESRRFNHELRPCKTEKETERIHLLDVNKSKKIYRGKAMTLEAQDVEANLLLLSLAEFSGYSLIMDAGYNTEISIKKTQVPWDQALDKIAEFLNLKAKILNQIIYLDRPVFLRKFRPRTKKYSGMPLSLDFYTIKARVLLNVLADFSGNALIIDANIDKKITINRKHTPWDQVLDELAEFLDLKAQVINGIIYVDTPVSLWNHKQNEKQYQGKKLSLNLLSISVSDLFNILAEFSGSSFVLATHIDKKINREISIKRDKTPWDQILAEVLEFLNLKSKVSNGVVYIEDRETYKHHKTR